MLLNEWSYKSIIYFVVTPKPNAKWVKHSMKNWSKKQRERKPINNCDSNECIYTQNSYLIQTNIQLKAKIETLLFLFLHFENTSVFRWFLKSRAKRKSNERIHAIRCHRCFCSHFFRNALLTEQSTTEIIRTVNILPAKFETLRFGKQWEK